MAGASQPPCAMRSPEPVSVSVTVEADTTLPVDITEEALAALVHHVLTEEGQGGAWEIGIRFVDDPTMQRAHREFMGIDTPTDIMTFPYGGEAFDELPGAGAPGIISSGGDLLISTDRAAEHARDAGWDTSSELRFLVCHGVLHLLGWDDATDEQRAAMLGRQFALLEGFERA